MPDLVISVGAEDQAGDVLRKVSEAFSDMGKKAKEAAEKPQSAVKQLAAMIRQDLIGGFTDLKANYEAFKNMASKVGEFAVQFAKDSVKAYMEQQRVDALLSSSLKQLGYDAEALTETLKNQADAFEGTLGVSNEMVQTMQSLMIRYGTAPRDVRATTAAILDYAAATGQNAESATQQLLKAIEGGGAGLKKMGIDIKETGNKSTDLALAVEALGAKFGGAALANAGTLAGQVAILGTKVEGVQKAFGGFLATLEARFGIIQSVSDAFDEWTTAMGGGEAAIQKGLAERGKALQDLQMQRYKKNEELEEQEKILYRLTEAGLEVQAREQLGIVNRLTATVDGLDAAIKKQKEFNTAQGNIVAGVTNEGQSAAAAANDLAATEKAKRLKDAAALAKEEQKIREDNAAALDKWDADDLDLLDKNRVARKSAYDAQLADYVGSRNKQVAAEAEESKRNAEEFQKMQADMAAEAQVLRDANEAAFAAAGAGIGSAFTSALTGEFTALASGGEFDIGNIISSMIPVLITAALLGTPAAPFAPLIGGALSAMIGSFHDGGWPGDGSTDWKSAAKLEHDERPAVLQVGERVLSRKEVGAMGGRDAVDRAARGKWLGDVPRHHDGAWIERAPTTSIGGGMQTSPPPRTSERQGRPGRGETNVYISAMDSQSMVENFSGRGGRAMNQAVRRGQGELAQLLRKRGR